MESFNSLELKREGASELLNTECPRQASISFNSLETGKHRQSAIGGETIEAGYHFLFRFPSNGNIYVNQPLTSVFVNSETKSE